MVLAVMVCILIFRVYTVLNPSIEGPGDQMLGPPNPTPPDDLIVPIPPAPPRGSEVEDWSRLWRFSLFNYRQPRAGSRPGSEDDRGSELQITLEQIRDAGDGTYRAKIRTASRSSWYQANESFEQFTLMSIDPEKQCVTIFSEQEAKNLEKCVEPAP
jgi:hypothetical protein